MTYAAEPDGAGVADRRSPGRGATAARSPGLARARAGLGRPGDDARQLAQPQGAGRAGRRRAPGTLTGGDSTAPPDDRFADLPDFPWPPSYAEVADPATAARVRMAYVDAGPADGPVALLLHGEPSWSFLYRHVIAGARRRRGSAASRRTWSASGAPTSRWRAGRPHATRGTSSGSASSPSTTTGLRAVTLVGQDWGGLIGLRLVAGAGGPFVRVVAADAGLPTGDFDMPEIWWMFHDAVGRGRRTRHRAAGGRRLRARDEPTGYGRRTTRPSPARTAKVGARVMPTLVPHPSRRPGRGGRPASLFSAAWGEWAGRS